LSVRPRNQLCGLRQWQCRCDLNPKSSSRNLDPKLWTLTHHTFKPYSPIPWYPVPKMWLRGDAIRSLVDTSPQTWSKQPLPAQTAWTAPRVILLQTDIEAGVAGTR